MNTLTLRTGEVVAEPVVIATTRSLDYIQKHNGVALFEIVELARNPGYSMWGNTAKFVEDCGLTQDGVLHEETRKVILASVEGDGLNLHLVNPL